MATRYDRITIEGAVEFAGPFASVVEPSYEQQQDPRFLAFVDWCNECRLKNIRVDIASRGPGNITVL